MNKKRPVNLAIETFSLPVTAYVSILHRISGVVLLALVLLLLWALDASLASPDSFDALSQTLGHPLIRFLAWGFSAALIYHLIAGCRHLLMDCGLGESLEGGRLGAKIVLVLSLLLIAAAGVYLLW